MKKIFVSGIINVESSVQIDAFPVEYNPVEYPFFGINSCVSGVGYNITKALKALGCEVDFATFIGDDIKGQVIRTWLEREGISMKHFFVSKDFPTAESLIFADKTGKRKIYCDLKRLQEVNDYPSLDVDFSQYDYAVLANINFNRGLIAKAKAAGCKIATDVHVLYGINDDFNQQFMENADILFLSNEAFVGHEGTFLKALYERYHNPIIVCGCGEHGALCYLGGADEYYFESATAPNGIVDSTGAGDALFSSFLYFYNSGYNIPTSLKFAVTFAGLAVGSKGGSNGFVSEEELRKYTKLDE